MAWTLPCPGTPGGWAGSAHPFTREAAPPCGEKSRPDWGTESPGMSQRQPERRRTPYRGADGSTLPRALCSHAELTGRQPQVQQASSTPSRQDTTNQTRAEMVPCFPAKGQQEGTRWTMGPREAQTSPHSIQSHILKATTRHTALGSSKSQTTTQNSRSSLQRMTHALWAAGPAPKPSLEDICQC